MNKIIKKITDIIEQSGETEYKYYAIPIRWRSGRGSRRGDHARPITGLENYETTKEEYLKNKDESKRLGHLAFMDKLECSYVSHERRVFKAGWRENLIKWLKDDNNFFV